MLLHPLLSFVWLSDQLINLMVESLPSFSPYLPAATNNEVCLFLCRSRLPARSQCCCSAHHQHPVSPWFFSIEIGFLIVPQSKRRCLPTSLDFLVWRNPYVFQVFARFKSLTDILLQLLISWCVMPSPFRRLLVLTMLPLCLVLINK